MKLSKELEEQLRKLDAQQEDLRKNKDALKDDIAVARESESPKIDMLDTLEGQFKEGVDTVQRIMNSAEMLSISENVRKHMEQHKTEPAFDKLYYATHVEGIVNKNERLEYIKYDKDAYDKMSLENPLYLIGEIRYACEQQGRNIQNMIVNKIPMDRNLLATMTPKEQREAFKTVLLASFDKLAKRFKFDRIPEVDEHLRLEEVFVTFVELSFQYGNIYQFGWDSCTPVFVGLDGRVDQVLHGYTDDKANIIKGITQYETELKAKKAKFELDEAQEKVNADKLGIQAQQIANNDLRISTQNDTLLGLQARIEEKKKELANVGKEGSEEGDEES